MIRTYLSALFAIAAVACQAQGYLQFEKQAQDLGSIREEEGDKTTTFTFRNTGTTPVKLLSVTSSCGCTTSGWSVQPVSPGDSAKIDIHYNPLNRPGRFKKSIFVSSTATNEQVTLSISGYVQPRVKSPVDFYSRKAGSLWTQTKSLNMGKITTEKPTTKSFSIYNGGEKSLTFDTAKTLTASYITVSFDPDTLAPQSAGALVVTYDGLRRGKLGFSSDNLKIMTNEELMPVKEFYIITTVEEYFPPLTDEARLQAPSLSINRQVVDLGFISQNTTTATFLMTNRGGSNLILRDIQTNCGCTVASWPRQTLRAGEHQELTVQFTPGRRTGRQSKTVTIFSNDPTMPTQVLTIKAEVR